MTYKIFKENLENLKNSSQPLVVFGLGEVFREYFSLFQEKKIPISCICDNNTELHGTFFQGYKVVSLDTVKEELQDPIFIVAWPQEIKEQLEDKGFTQYYEIFLVVKFLEGTFRWEDYIYFEERNNQRYEKEDSEILFVNNLDIYITDRCSLNCKDCCNLIPYFKKPQDYEYEYLTNQIDEACLIFDHISQIHLLGGEPFLHPQVYSLIQYACTKENVSYINLFSNGTIPLKEEEVAKFDPQKVIFTLTKYKELSRSMAFNLELLNRYDIFVYYKEDTEWFDCIDFDRQNYTLEQVKKVYDTCCTKYVKGIHDGNLYKCSYAIALTKLKAVPQSALDCVNLSQYPSKEARDRGIKKYLYGRDFINTCYYCKGRSEEINTMIEAAVQIKGKIPYSIYEEGN